MVKKRMWRKKMKRFLTIIVLLFTLSFASYGGYIHLKLDLGRHSGYLINTNRIVYKEAKYDISGGVSAEFNFSRAFALEFGAFYKTYKVAANVQYILTDTNKIAYYTPIYKVHYLSIPSYFKLYFLNEEISPYFFVGADINFYLNSSYEFEDPDGTGIGPYDGKHKDFRVFFDIGLGVLFAPDSLGLEIEIHLVNDFGYMFKTKTDDDYNVRINGVELVIGKRF